MKKLKRKKKVYVVVFHIPYEGDQFVDVFSSKKKAEANYDTKMDRHGNYYDITETELK